MATVQQAQEVEPVASVAVTPTAPSPAPIVPILTDEELARLQAEDWKAAASIVGIMGTIFTLALCGYIGISLWVFWER